MPRLLAALLLALAALSARAEVYKWVDEKGRVTYSNTRPPAVAGKAKVIEEQISVIGMDPAVRAWANAMEQRAATRAALEERELQAARANAMVLQSSAPDSGYDQGYYPSYYYPYGYAGYIGRRPFRPAFPRVEHHVGTRASIGVARGARGPR